MRRLTLLCLAVLLYGAPAAFAQSAQGILSSSRSIDWSRAGVTGGIPNRTTICSNLTSSNTLAQINSAIAACPSGQVVKLAAGTYNLAGGILLNRSNVTLRGSGADATLLVFSGENNCGGVEANVCVMSSSYIDVDSSANATWSGAAQGATSVTLSSVSGLTVGAHLYFDQSLDTSDTYPEAFQCHAGPSVCSNSSDTRRDQMQIVTVTGISGNTVTFTPGLYMPNWRSAKSPRAIWSGLPSSGMGVEDLSINSRGSSLNAVGFLGVTNSWLKGVRAISPNNHHVKLYATTHVTIRDNYFFDVLAAAEETYGVDDYFSSDNLIENNIFQHMATPVICEHGAGTVAAYNFSIMDNFPGEWAQASSYTHSAGCNFYLFEGNSGFGLNVDHYHGTGLFITAFRNRWEGWEPGKQQQTVPIMIPAFSRYINVIGNVLGTSSHHTNYQRRVITDSENLDLCYHSIYAIGHGGNCENGGGQHPPNDARVLTTLMRWGNWDTVTNGSKFDSTEVPSGIPQYGNPVPSSQTLPPSFYLAAKPAFFGSVPWPAAGPDITGGDVPNVGGRAYRIPARRCFENVMGGTFSDTSARTFNASNCYQATGAAPSAPTNLRIISSAFLMPVVFGMMLRRRRFGRE